jgi:hypothetical protein
MTTSKQPANIVLILSDQLRADCVAGFLPGLFVGFAVVHMGDSFSEFCNPLEEAKSDYEFKFVTIRGFAKLLCYLVTAWIIARI